MSLVPILLSILTGICLYAAIQNLLAAGTRQRPDAIFLVFGLAALLAGAYTQLRLLWYLSSDIIEAVRMAKATEIVATALCVILAWSIWLYIRRRSIRAPAILTGLGALLFLANLVSPLSLRYRESDRLDSITLPWGETLSFGSGPDSPWWQITIGLHAAVIVYALSAAMRQWHRGEKKRAVTLASAFSILGIAVVHDGCVSSGVWRSLYLTEYGYTALVVMISLSLTRRVHRAETDLAPLDVQLRTVVDSLPAVLISVEGGTNRVLLIHGAVENMMGCTEEHFQNDPDLGPALVHPDDRAYVAEHYNRGLASGRPFDLEYRLVHHRTGDPIWVQQRVVPVTGADGTLLRQDAVVVDVTDQKRTEQALRESEERYRSLFEGAHDAVFLMSGDLFLECNQRTLRMFGCARADIVGQSPFAFSPERQPDGRASREAGEEKIALAWRGEPQVFDWQHRRPDGTLFDTEVSLNRVELSGATHLLAIVRDVTERKRLDQAIRAILEATAGAITGEDFFRNLVQHLASALGVRYAMVGSLIDPGARRLTTLAVWDGEGFAENFEYDLAGTPCETVVGQKLCTYTRQVCDRFPADRILTDLQAESYMGIPLFDSKGQALGILSILDDRPMEETTLAESLLRIFSTRASAELERSRFEAELAEAEASLLAAIEQSPAGILVADAPDVRIRLANSASLGIRGEPSEPLTDIPLSLHPGSWQTLYPDGAPYPPEELPLSRAVLRGEVVRNEEVVICRPGGEERWVLANAAPIRNAEGDIVAGVVVFPDITDLKRAQREAQRLRNLLGNIIDSMPSALVAVDREGRVTHWNREAELLAGVPEADARGGRLDELLPGFAAHERLIEAAIRERRLQKKEKMTLQCDRRRRLTDMMVYPLVGEGMEGAVVRLDDVTERVRLEELMIQSEKMATVGGLAAGMAHEINNPLGAILQSSQNLMRRLSSELAKNAEVARSCGTSLEAIQAYIEQREIPTIVEGIRESGSRAAEIVANILRFSRRSRAEVTRANLAELIDRTLDLAASDYDLRKQYDFRHIRIIRELDPSLPPVPCVRTEIEQVLLNLLKNSAQAMAKATTAGEPHIVIRTRREQNRALIEVEDNGPGMPAEIRRRVFEPFFTTKDVGVGTGLGLSVSYMIITNNHHGTIEVDSAPDHGTKFSIRLPLERAPG